MPLIVVVFQRPDLQLNGNLSLTMHFIILKLEFHCLNISRNVLMHLKDMLSSCISWCDEESWVFHIYGRGDLTVKGKVLTGTMYISMWNVKHLYSLKDCLLLNCLGAWILILIREIEIHSPNEVFNTYRIGQWSS